MDRDLFIAKNKMFCLHLSNSASVDDNAYVSLSASFPAVIIHAVISHTD